MSHKVNSWEGLQDVGAGISNLKLALYLAKADVRQRYRRSSLGPFWITLSMGIMIGTLGFIFGSIFKAPMSEFLPFLSAGLILWSFISQTILDATTVFPSAEGVIKQLPIPYFVHILRMVGRNFYIFGHNIVIYPIVCLCFMVAPSLNLLWIVPGLFVLLANLLWLSLFIGIICARYRDLTQVVNSLLQIIFYLTPIIWLPSLLPAKADVLILDANPFYHLLQIVREPLLNQSPTLSNWTVSILIALGGWIATVLLFNKYRNRIAYWL